MLNENEVKETLKVIGYDNPFTVVFLKNDGSQKTIKGATLVKSDKPPKNPNVVPVRDPESKTGWGSFYVSKVVSIQKES